MTYKIADTELIIQPTSGKWLRRGAVGIAGDGHAMYPGVRQFELKWQVESASGFNQLMNYFDTINPTGTVSIDLPRFAHSAYEFRTYSGCVLREPEAGIYFAENHTTVVLLVTNIATS